jgi:hypothetical protein
MLWTIVQDCTFLSTCCICSRVKHYWKLKKDLSNGTLCCHTFKFVKLNSCHYRIKVVLLLDKFWEKSKCHTFFLENFWVTQNVHRKCYKSWIKGKAILWTHGKHSCVYCYMPICCCRDVFIAVLHSSKRGATQHGMERRPLYLSLRNVQCFQVSGDQQYLHVINTPQYFLWKLCTGQNTVRWYYCLIVR